MEFFTTAAGISVHVWDTRDEKPNAGKCLFLLHGYLETMYVFNELVDALKDRYRVIVIDMPGHGLTDSAPADASGQRVNSLSFAVRTVVGVMDKCGVQRAVVAGHSMGGYVTQQLLREHPERVERAILLHSHPFPDVPEKAEDREREKALIAAGKLHALASVSVSMMYDEENLRACDEKIRETVELCETHDPDGIIASVEGLRTRPDLQDVWACPPVPLLLVYGDHDNYLPLERVEKLKDLYPKVSFQLIPGTGHNSFIERPEAAVAAITAFVESPTTGNC